MSRKKTFKKPVKSLKGKPLRQVYKAGTDVSVAGLKSAIIEALFEVDFDTFKGCIALLLDKCDYKKLQKKPVYQKARFTECVSQTLIPHWKIWELYA